MSANDFSSKPWLTMTSQRNVTLASIRPHWVYVNNHVDCSMLKLHLWFFEEKVFSWDVLIGSCQLDFEFLINLLYNLAIRGILDKKWIIVAGDADIIQVKM